MLLKSFKYLNYKQLSFSADVVSPNEGCNSVEITKTYIKGWKTYISLHNSEIEHVFEPYYYDEFNNFTVTFFSIWYLSLTKSKVCYFM